MRRLSEFVVNEFKKHNIRYEIEHVKGGHLKVTWNMGERNLKFYQPNSGSDVRGGLNARSELRRLIRKGNMQ
jgi:hypothetical protein